MTTNEKVQKVLARLGYGSRREIERWISAGRVTVDEKPLLLGARISSLAGLCLDGHQIIQPKAVTKAPRLILYYKPEGEICTRHDPEQRETVFDRLPKLNQQRWVMVGRLDFNTSGLLLFTNDGELAHRLMHPSFNHEREYAVRVLGEVSTAALNQLRKGVLLEGKLAKFTAIQFAGGTGANSWYHVTVTEGRHRMVRRMWQSLGFTVSRLTRIRYGTISLPSSLQRGQWQEWSSAEVVGLLASIGYTLHR